MSTSDAGQAQLRATPSSVFSSITARLSARHDAMSVLNAVTDACATFLRAQTTGILIIDPRGGITSLGGSDEPTRLVELTQASTEQGPCVDAIASATLVAVPDLVDGPAQWPRFSSMATDLGFRAVYSFPLRLDHHAIGGLNLFYTHPTRLSDTEHELGQALADLAVLGLTQERDERRVERLAERTLTTLNDRAHLAQATGVVAQTLVTDPDTARDLIYTHSRRNQQSVRDTAQALTDNNLDPHDLTATTP
jgi:GAF domain-containing protein